MNEKVEKIWGKVILFPILIMLVCCNGQIVQAAEQDDAVVTTTDAYHFSVRILDGKFYFTWDLQDSESVYRVEYSIIPTAGFLEEGWYEEVPAEEGKMCYVVNALPYKNNSPLYFRLKHIAAKCYSDANESNTSYSDVIEFNWPTYKYKVTFMDGEKVVLEEDVCEGGSVHAPELEKEGYTLSWDGDYSNVTSDVTVYAVWTKKETDGNEQVGNIIRQISLNGASTKIAAGKKLQLKADILPKDATNQTLVWTSSKEAYATVSQNGLVTTRKNGAGKTVTIKASAKDGSGMVATYKIKIMKHAVKSIKVTAKSKTVKAGKKLTLKASVKTTGKSANKTLTWTSSNKKYATVSSNGVVKTTKQGKGKTVTITARATDGTGKKGVVKIRIR